MPRGHYAHLSPDQIEAGRLLVASMSWNAAAKELGVAGETLKSALVPGYREQRTARIRNARHRRDGLPGLKPRKPRGPHIRKTHSKVSKPVFKRVAPPPPPRVPDIARVKLVELTNETCRFPIGNPVNKSFGYCGALEADFAAGRPYCPAHHARCFTGLPPRRKRVGTASHTDRPFGVPV